MRLPVAVRLVTVSLLEMVITLEREAVSRERLTVRVTSCVRVDEAVSAEVVTDFVAVSDDVPVLRRGDSVDDCERVFVKVLEPFFEDVDEKDVVLEEVRRIERVFEKVPVSDIVVVPSLDGVLVDEAVVESDALCVPDPVTVPVTSFVGVLEALGCVSLRERLIVSAFDEENEWETC